MIAERKAIRALYICYFGLREPLVHTQVIPYLREIVAGGIEVSLLTFEPRQRREWSSEEERDWRARLEVEGIRWMVLPYHKRPSLPATVYDILNGVRLASKLVSRERIDVMHARGYVPAAIGALAKRVSGGRLIFDIRGFMAEEYADAGIWKAGGFLFRLVKAAERRLLAAADGFVVLTEQARRALFPDCLNEDAAGRPVEVIPCCVDMERFRLAHGLSKEEVRREFGLTGRRVLAYVGALGGWYLTDEMAEFLAAAREHDGSSFCMILSQSPPEIIGSRLKQLGFKEEDYFIGEVAPGEVPRYLKAADIALSFIKPCYSKLASSPTKIAEYLASGLPVVCNAGIGDLDELIDADRVGVIVRGFDRDCYSQALIEAEALRQDPDLSDRCRASAQSRFDLEQVGGARYRRLYDRLVSREQACPTVSQVL